VLGLAVKSARSEEQFQFVLGTESSRSFVDSPTADPQPPLSVLARPIAKFIFKMNYRPPDLNTRHGLHQHLMSLTSHRTQIELEIIAHQEVLESVSESHFQLGQSTYLSVCFALHS
jgi:hypothetical protein